jgi:hypothetical protein
MKYVWNYYCVVVEGADRQLQQKNKLDEKEKIEKLFHSTSIT